MNIAALLGAGLVLSLVGAKASAAELDTAQEIVQEVISRSEGPHAYDWRKASAELQVGLGYTSEANNFDNSVYELGVGLPTNAGSMLRLGLRRAFVHGSESSDNIGRTPFSQASQSTRYEVYGGYAYGLLEGRAMTRLTPRLPDFETALFFWAGGHYSHPNKSWIPKRSDPPARLAGQDAADKPFNLELGLRWHVYLPQSLGLAFEAMQVRPIGGGGGLRYWAYYSCGVLWAFGAH